MSEIDTTAGGQRPAARNPIDWRSWRAWVVFLGSALATGGLAGAVGMGVHRLVEYTFERQLGKPVVVLLIFVAAQLAALTLLLVARTRSRQPRHGGTAPSGRTTLSEAVGLPKLVLWELVVFVTGVGTIWYYLQTIGVPAANGYGALVFLVVPVSEIARQLLPPALLRRAAG